jgi:hypothetical protein
LCETFQNPNPGDIEARPRCWPEERATLQAKRIYNIKGDLFKRNKKEKKEHFPYPGIIIFDHQVGFLIACIVANISSSEKPFAPYIKSKVDWIASLFANAVGSAM